MADGYFSRRTFNIWLQVGMSRLKSKIPFQSGPGKFGVQKNGSKHGNPASAEAAMPQGTND
jgi:hypothetical protein